MIRHDIDVGEAAFLLDTHDMPACGPRSQFTALISGKLGSGMTVAAIALAKSVKTQVENIGFNYRVYADIPVAFAERSGSEVLHLVFAGDVRGLGADTTSRSLLVLHDRLGIHDPGGRNAQGALRFNQLMQDSRKLGLSIVGVTNAGVSDFVSGLDLRSGVPLWKVPWFRLLDYWIEVERVGPQHKLRRRYGLPAKPVLDLSAWHRPSDRPLSDEGHPFGLPSVQVRLKGLEVLYALYGAIEGPA